MADKKGHRTIESNSFEDSATSLTAALPNKQKETTAAWRKQDLPDETEDPQAASAFRRPPCLPPLRWGCQERRRKNRRPTSPLHNPALNRDARTPLLASTRPTLSAELLTKNQDPSETASRKTLLRNTARKNAG